MTITISPIRLAITTVIALLLLVSGFAGGYHYVMDSGKFAVYHADHNPSADPFPLQVQEDEPGWDCRTMGNRTCGFIEQGPIEGGQ